MLLNYHEGNHRPLLVSSPFSRRSGMLPDHFGRAPRQYLTQCPHLPSGLQQRPLQRPNVPTCTNGPNELGHLLLGLKKSVVQKIYVEPEPSPQINCQVHSHDCGPRTSGPDTGADSLAAFGQAEAEVGNALLGFTVHYLCIQLLQVLILYLYI